MKSTLAIWGAMLIAIIFAASCGKSNNETEQIVKVKYLSESLGKPVKINIQGKVLGSNQKPLDSVLIIVGSKTISTNKGGNFILKNVATHQNLVSIEVRKIGYKNALMNYTSEDLNNLVSIILHKETELCLFWLCKDNHNLD